MSRTAKLYLTPREATDLGYFASVGAAANLRYRGIGPRSFDVPGRGIVYAVDDLERWIREGEMLTASTLPLEQRSRILG